MHNVKHYLFLDGEQRGPYTFSQLQGMWRNGAVTSETMHFMDGYADWMPLEVIVQDLEPPLPPPMRDYHTAPSPRPMVVANRQQNGRSDAAPLSGVGFLRRVPELHPLADERVNVISNPKIVATDLGELVDELQC